MINEENLTKILDRHFFIKRVPTGIWVSYHSNHEVIDIRNIDYYMINTLGIKDINWVENFRYDYVNNKLK